MSLKEVPSNNLDIYYDDNGGELRKKTELDKKFFFPLQEEITVAHVKRELGKVSRSYAEAARNRAVLKILLQYATDSKKRRLTEIEGHSRYDYKQVENLLKDSKGTTILSTLSFLEASKIYYDVALDHLKALYKALETIVGAEGVNQKILDRQ